MTKEEKNETCRRCNIRKIYAQFDIHFDWLDCPYECDAIGDKKIQEKGGVE